MQTDVYMSSLPLKTDVLCFAGSSFSVSQLCAVRPHSCSSYWQCTHAKRLKQECTPVVKHGYDWLDAVVVMVYNRCKCCGATLGWLSSSFWVVSSTQHLFWSAVTCLTWNNIKQQQTASVACGPVFSGHMGVEINIRQH